MDIFSFSSSDAITSGVMVPFDQLPHPLYHKAEVAMKSERSIPMLQIMICIVNFFNELYLKFNFMIGLEI